ncbi:MAG TPA: hypothetical protein VFY37_07910 [Solirubrobacterales bacterium]|nr:hypothetical protein [Solirubrobacterales bacterium]
MRPRITYANVVSTLALLLVVTGGTAYALDGSNTVFTDDLVNGDVTVADIGRGAVATDEIANNQVKAADIGGGEVKAAEIANGRVRTQEIGNGQVQAQDLAPAASGARAWGLVSGFGVLLRGKNITAVTHPDGGVYCVDPGAGINPNTSIMVAGENNDSDITGDNTDQIAHAEWDSAPTSCPVGAMEVKTFVGFGIPGSGGQTDFGGFNLFLIDTPFTFVIP